MPKETPIQIDTQTQIQTIAGFLEGMYYAGKLPSRAECREIAHYLRSRSLVNGTQREAEVWVAEAMAAIHREQEEREIDQPPPQVSASCKAFPG